MPKFTPVDWKTLECVFLAAGFSFARPVVIPAYPEVPVFIIRNNLKTAGISRDEYFQLLEKCR